MPLPRIAESVETPAPSQPTRDELILQHLAQVKLIARQVNERLPVSVGLEDLESAGILGLIAAIDRFDPKQQVKLRTYAEYKIRGAILDSLRTMDWAPRMQRRRNRQIEAAITNLEQTLNRVPTQEEVATQLGLTNEQYQDWLTSARGLSLGSLDAIQADEDGRNLLQYVSDAGEKTPAQILEKSEIEHLLVAAIEFLPDLEKTILNLYYFEELTLKEIAQIVNLHESRISQLKTQAVLRLRAALKR